MTFRDREFRRFSCLGTQLGGCYCRSQWLRSGYKRWYKKRANRKMRRWGKQDPENAPTKLRYSGWY